MHKYKPGWHAEHTNQRHVPLPQTLRKTPGTLPRDALGAGKLPLLLQSLKCQHYSFPWQFHSPPPSWSWRAAKRDMFALIWEKLSLWASFSPLSLILTLMAEYQQPKNAPALLASLLLSPILNTHHFLLKLFQLLNGFQNEYTLNTRWLQLNGSFTKVTLLKYANDNTQLLYTSLSQFSKTFTATFHLLLKLGSVRKNVREPHFLNQETSAERWNYLPKAKELIRPC